MNRLPKYVVSTTLSEARWNNSRLIKDQIAQAVTRLKHEVGQDILIFGSGELVHTLMTQSLIDEYRLLVHPVMVGRGALFFKDLKERSTLKLVETKIFEKGVVLLCYQPAEI